MPYRQNLMITGKPETFASCWKLEPRARTVFRHAASVDKNNDTNYVENCVKSRLQLPRVRIGAYMNNPWSFGPKVRKLFVSHIAEPTRPLTTVTTIA